MLSLFCLRSLFLPLRPLCAHCVRATIPDLNFPILDLDFLGCDCEGQEGDAESGGGGEQGLGGGGHCCAGGADVVE